MRRAAWGFALLVGAAPAWALEAGVAVRAFDVPDRVPLAGYSRRGGKPSDGVHDPVEARALVFSEGSSHVALVAADLLVIDEELYSEVRRALQEEPPFDGPVSLLLSATHTHSGPGAYGRHFLEKVSMGHYDPAARAAIVEGIVEAVRDAAAGRRQARIACDAVRAPGLSANRMLPNGLVDDELGLCGVFDAATATPFAIVVNFSAHPTTLGASNMELSADYPGAMRRALEASLPGTRVVFFSGAVADQAPVKQGEGFEPAERLGARLAEVAREGLPDAARAQEASAMGVREAVARLDPARVRIGRLRLPGWMGRRLVDDDAHLMVVRVGPAAFFGVPCDLTADLGARLKAAARARGWHPMIAGFANDYIGYCLPAEAYGQDSYEASMAFNGPHTGERLTGQLQAMLEELSRGVGAP